MGFENCKNAAQFPFMQPKNTSLVPNTTPFIDFGLNMLATGHAELTIRISVVTQPLNFPVFNRVSGTKSPSQKQKQTLFHDDFSIDCQGYETDDLLRDTFFQLTFLFT